ncbi:hypothetical protein [Halomarina rubra]|uniref:4-vinyl reductase 4VR domain-containing protein n=1 Tax=Halomarina rubra TaxID=2071873 RepID=A0ABD6AUU8_9EURY|nr:hypothetical protein [Halomarina rubra]
MAQYEAFDQRTEVHGRTILVVVDDALARFSEEYRTTALDTLAANGVDDPTPDGWYPQQAWLDTMETIADELEPHLLDRLGGQIPAVAPWPDGISTVEAGLQSIDDAYQSNHRGGDAGYYEYEHEGDRTGRVTCANPYPCLFDRGLVRAVARQHAPVKSFVFVEERGQHCRRAGDDTCTYTVSW